MVHDESQIVICAGIPGKPGLAVEGGKPYPDTAIDMAKVIREHGLTVSFEDDREKRKYVEHKATDVWLPILQVTIDILTGISSGLFTMLIADLLGADKAEKSILYVEYRVTDRRGKVQEFKAEGPGKEVMEAVDKFERRLRG
jgi:hypothetical protein